MSLFAYSESVFRAIDIDSGRGRCRPDLPGRWSHGRAGAPSRLSYKWMFWNTAARPSLNHNVVIVSIWLWHWWLIRRDFTEVLGAHPGVIDIKRKQVVCHWR